MRLFQTPVQAAQWLREQVGSGSLSVDSRCINAGDGFIAWPGAAVDGRLFVEQVLSSGAAACLVEAQSDRNWSWADDPRVGTYFGLKKDLSKIAALYYGDPSKSLEVLAITGTNGKTSTSWWVAQALTTLKHKCGVIGTLGMGTLDDLEDSGLTTPDPIRLHRVLRSLKECGVKACSIEASSIGLEEYRFDGVQVKVALLTNVTQDHLDYHGTMDAYWQAKRRLFDWRRGLDAVVINRDDPYGEQLAKELQAERGAKKVITYSIADVNVLGRSAATIRAVNLEYLYDGVAFDLCESDDVIPMQLGLLGGYNISNLLGVVGVLRALGYSLRHAALACQHLMPVPGRLQNVFSLNENACKVVVDYAHTPDALENVLQTLQPLAMTRGGRLLCLFGCGGERDATKRSKMGRIAQTLADVVVVTSDNPRGDDPQIIIQHIKSGMSEERGQLYLEPNRRRAIELVLKLAAPEDIVLLAGKGHEWYQEIKGHRYPFSDAGIASQILNAQITSVKAQVEGTNDVVMGMLTLRQVKEILQSQGIVVRLHGDGERVFARVNSDTRTLQEGDLFVALKGDSFDGHDFVMQAFEKGAVAVLAERGFDSVRVVGLEVNNTLKALAALARGWRDCFSIPVIGVTGSNGKTTVTQMIASILNVALGDDALATQGNFNNEIGVPLSVLRLRAGHKAAVFELGMNHVGEIEKLAHIVQPTVALVNNAQREHLEFMDTVQAVAHENGQVIDALPLSGTAVLPVDDVFINIWKGLAQQRKVVTFGLEQVDADYYVKSFVWNDGAWNLDVHTPQGVLVSRLHCAGLHNVKNVIAAVACAAEAGISLGVIADGIRLFQPVKGRSQVEVVTLGQKKVTLVNDTYNANPDSVRAAIDVLSELPQPSLLILGDMGEVGASGKEFHEEVGVYAREKNITTLFGLGEMVKDTVEAFDAKSIQGHYFTSIDFLNQALAEQAKDYASILVKGSRFMRMERVVVYLQEITNTVGDHHAA